MEIEDKVEIKMESGCGFMLSMDGRCHTKLSTDELDALLDKVFKRLRSDIHEHATTLVDLMEIIQPDESECDYTPCDTCGSSFSESIWWV